MQREITRFARCFNGGVFGDSGPPSVLVDSAALVCAAFVCAAFPCAAFA